MATRQSWDGSHIISFLVALDYHAELAAHTSSVRCTNAAVPPRRQRIGRANNVQQTAVNRPPPKSRPRELRRVVPRQSLPPNAVDYGFVVSTSFNSCSVFGASVFTNQILSASAWRTM